MRIANADGAPLPGLEVRLWTRPWEISASSGATVFGNDVVWTATTDSEGSCVFPDLPPDTMHASGYEGRAVLVIPSRKTVIVRLGRTKGYSNDPAKNRSTWDLNAFAAGVLASLP